MAGKAPTLGPQAGFVAPGTVATGYVPGANAPLVAAGSPVQTTNQPGPLPLQLGSVIFNTEEVPNDLAFGVEMRMHVTELIGGGRVVQVLGAQPSEVTWNGRIWGPNVQARVQALRAMTVAGIEVPLSWSIERYYCVVKSFVPKYLGVDCEYAITVVITRDANGAISSVTPTSVDTQVAALSQTASGKAAGVAAAEAAAAPGSPNAPNLTGPSISSVQQSIAKVQAALAVAGPVAQLAGINLTSVSNVVTTASGVATAYAAATAPGATKLTQALQCATALNLINRNIIEGQSSSVTQYFGGSLAEIAAMQYGSADLAPLIAQVNGIQGLRLPPGVLTTLTLPPFPMAPH